ncbi:hypothetical protein GQ43DRAFT_9343 [Delitschia confertaspora ATCC 74209]|uniref:F-box domain-containing protein n=1 Tax=Delitschia confertaspora ATCC 74209 TaxID=1513339 RepID=A0A9P4JN21_9PLEO|nr:hypothetical protein GQ43DRAFT_9343 [Delitschia confertaspora ATCC 74209]
MPKRKAPIPEHVELLQQQRNTRKKLVASEEVALSPSPVLDYPDDLTTNNACPFLQKLPLEIRLDIYEYLLIEDESLRGRDAREKKHYGFSLAILRVNRQISLEAHDVFLGKNTFFVSARSNHINDRITADNYGAIDPPLASRCWGGVRHLTLDLMYYPENVTTADLDRDCVAYLTNLTQLLRAAAPRLRSLSISACMAENFNARRSLITFFMCDRESAFMRTLSSITSVASIPIKFDFPDSFYHVSLKPAALQKRSILLLACQVMFCQSQYRIDRLLKCFDDGGLMNVPKNLPKYDLTSMVEKANENREREKAEMAAGTSVARPYGE